MRTSTCAVLCLLLASLTPLNAQQPVVGDDGRSDVESKIISLEKRLWNGDVSKLEADDYEAIKHAHRYHRSDDEAAAKEAKFALVSMDDIRVSMLRPDVALMTYHATEKGSFRGTPVPASLYFGSIWVNRGGEWKNVFLEENIPDGFPESYMPRSGSKSGSVLQNASDKSATDDTNELMRIETDLRNAYVHRDFGVPDRYVAEEFVGVDRSGSIYSKQQDMQAMKDGTFALKSFKEEDVQVRLLGDAAVVTGRNTATSLYKGKEDSFTIRFVDAFLRRDGRWQMVYSQDTNIADGTRESLEREISANEKQMLDLSARKDLEAYGRRLPDDALGVYGEGYASKADVLRAISGMSDLHYSMDDVRVIPVGNAAGLIVYRITQDWKEGGKKLARQYFVSSLWQNRDGKWLNPFWQETDATLSDDDLSTQALAKEREILETLKHNDWSAFSALLADDAVAIDEDGIHSKQELLDEIQAAGTRFSDYKMENVKVIPQADGAIVAYKETLVGTEHGKPFTWHIYTHSHWERRGGKWLMTMFQDSTAKD